MFKTMPDAVVLFDFELMLNSLVNSYCHIETLTPFYGTFARKSDPNNALNITTQVSHYGYYILLV